MSGVGFPAELGDLTNLTRLDLRSIGLSGTIPAELGDLTNLNWLSLGDNDLSGTIPAELGNLTNLNWLFLGGNNLSGCVPFALSRVLSIRFDATLRYCGVATVTPSDSRARESDGVAVFTLAVVPPSGSSAGDPTAATVDYATVAGSAVAGSDFTAVSGTVTVPAGSRYVSVSVPLVNDSIVEGDESFTLLLSNPVGAVLTRTSVTATIVDDDLGLPAPFVPVGVCDDGAVAGSVSDVFDVSQSGFGQWHQVFVDIDLTCGGRLTSGVGFPTAARVIYGPATSVGLSRHCVTDINSVRVTASRTAAGGCRTFASPIISQLAQDGRSTHILRIPDSAIGEAHQIRVWVDYDGDGVRDVDEESHIFAADFVSRADAADGFGLAEDFEVVNRGRADRLWRAGELVTLRLAAYLVTGESVYDPLLNRPVPERRALRNAQLGAFVYSGPSRAAGVMCVVPGAPGSVSPVFSSNCVTDSFGYVTLRYRVQSTAGSSGPEQDDVRIFWDRNANGAFDGAPNHPAREPSDTIQVRIAKSVNYVALGDSYSSGEAGDSAHDDFDGTYLADDRGGTSCRRWSLAYPAVIEKEFLGGELGITVEFATFACTGAKTHNIYDPADPNPVPLLPISAYDINNPPPTAHDTDRPSSSAVLGEPVYRMVPRQAPVLEEVRDSRWEPRQAVSLAGVQAMGDVDMITVTIGGNDAGFGAVLMSCALLGCGEVDSGVFDEVEDLVVTTLGHLKAVAPEASIFVLGYPAVPPLFEGCATATPEMIDTFEQTGLSGVFLSYGLSERCVDAIRDYVAEVRACVALDGAEALHATAGGIPGILGDAVAYLLAANLRIDAAEAVHLRNAAYGLNAAVLAAAESEGVHFVDVFSESASSDLSFWAHLPCDKQPWVNGVVPDEGEWFGVGGGSFHPNEEGHSGAARIVEAYITAQIAAGVGLSEAGLPVNPVPTSNGGARHPRHSDASWQPGGAALKQTNGAPTGQTDSVRSSSGDAEGTADSTADTVDYLIQRRLSPVSGCGAPFVSPGEQVTLAARGFAADTAVAFTVRAASADGTLLTVPSLAEATADATGVIDTTWTIPAAPAPGTDAAPRAYVVDASGLNPDGGTHMAFMVLPLVAYPGTALCATADTASTTLGAAVQITVLGNDTAPTGGSLDASSVEVRPAVGGSFAVDDTTGAVTFTPDAGFWGAVETTYVVYDGWGIGVEAALSVTVDAGCTITGTAGTALIEGTEGDDVICVPDRDDYRAFHIIDAKGGNDTVLGGAGEEWIYGGNGVDTIYGNGGDDEIIAGAGVDTVYGGTGMDRIYSVDTADTVIDDDYEMVLSPLVTVTQSGPDPADDWVWADVSTTVNVDVLGNDHDPNEDLDPTTLRLTQAPVVGTAVVTETANGVVVEYTAAAVGGADSFGYEVCDSLGNCATGVVTVMVGTTGCTIVGTTGVDVLLGTSGDDVICGLGGDDVIYGLGGDDVIVGGAGDDTLYGGDETLIGVLDGDDVLWGGAGDDTLYGGNGVDTLYGGVGHDSLHGNRRDDLIMGGPGDDVAAGGGENDLIWGGAGDDVLDGHAGDDIIWGGPGVDMVRGGDGDDTLWGNSGADTLIGGTGADRLHGGSGDDSLDGNSQDDVLWGGPGDDSLDGKGHDDQLLGGSGRDTLRGGPGDDRVYGGPGDDTLDGGNGVDHLDGGDGVDSCRRGGTIAGCETAGRL